jgi:hypothetical protein
LRLSPAPGHAEHLFVVFDRIFDSGPNMQGVDLAQSPQPVEAMTAARQSGALAVSPAYQLLRDSGVAANQRQTSVVLAAPVHTGLNAHRPATFEGWVVMAVRGQDLLSQTLIDRAEGAVQVSLTDPAQAGTVIAVARLGSRVSDDRLDRDRVLTVGQRRWQVSMWPTRRLLALTDRGISQITGAAGIALMIMLAVVTGVLAGSRRRALHQVEQATSALRHDIDRRETVEARLREREHQLHHLAFHDPLTGLANRQLFHERLSHALTTGGERTIAVLFVDLDGFKKSTTPAATTPETSSCKPWPNAYTPAYASATPSPASAATNSRSSSSHSPSRAMPTPRLNASSPTSSNRSTSPAYPQPSPPASASPCTSRTSPTPPTTCSATRTPPCTPPSSLARPDLLMPRQSNVLPDRVDASFFRGLSRRRRLVDGV